MLAEERWQIINSTLNSHSVVSVIDLSKRLNTSEVTIRRDLRELEKMGKLKRTHGGAIRVDQDGTSFEPQFSRLASENVELKKQIGKMACKFIIDNSAIIMDGSSTVLYMCKYIHELPLTNLMVVTNSVRVVTELASCDSVELVLIGGQIRKNLLSSTGLLSDLMLRELKVDKAFLGINGIDFIDNVMTTPNLSESSIKKSMMRCAKETIILADHSKFYRSYLSKVCETTDVGMIITDEGVAENTIKEAADRGVDLVIAEPLM